MDELSELIALASKEIEPGYFRLSIHGGHPVYRERVYCYEMYHQMRLLWPRPCAFALNGEVDKIAHPILSQLGADGYKPDFLVHTPGDMGGNHAVIEVKSADAAQRNCVKDLRTLALFRSKVGYARALYLIYGEDINDTLVTRIASTYLDMGERIPIELWVHQAPGTGAVWQGTLE
jgi:hypothetical protein